MPTKTKTSDDEAKRAERFLHKPEEIHWDEESQPTHGVPMPPEDPHAPSK